MVLPLIGDGCGTSAFVGLARSRILTSCLSTLAGPFKPLARNHHFYGYRLAMAQIGPLQMVDQATHHKQYIVAWMLNYARV